MPLKINGSTSGSVTLAAPATGSDVTVTLPGTAGTVALTASPTLTTATLSDPTLTGNVVWSGAVLRAATATVATGQTTTTTSYTDLATAGPSVTLTTGTKALVIISTRMYVGAGSTDIYTSYAVSGATTIAASDSTAIALGSSGVNLPVVGASWASLLTGLTAGSNTFTMKYRVSGSTGTWDRRYITVIDMGS